MKKIKYERIVLSKPRCYRLPLELDNILVTLADAAGVSPGILTREYMENFLGNFKFVAAEKNII